MKHTSIPLARGDLKNMAQQSSSNDGIELSSSSVNNQSNSNSNNIISAAAATINSVATNSSNTNSGGSNVSNSLNTNNGNGSSCNSNSSNSNITTASTKQQLSNMTNVANGSMAAMNSNNCSTVHGNMLQQQHMNMLNSSNNSNDVNMTASSANEMLTKPTAAATTTTTLTAGGLAAAPLTAQPPPLVFPHNNNYAKCTPMLQPHVHAHQQQHQHHHAQQQHHAQQHQHQAHHHHHQHQHQHHPYMPKVLENLVIYENFDVHETHRIEDGVCTHFTRLPPKKQELLKQFGIQSNQTVTYYEKYLIIENFIKFCNEYKISDHRPFLDFHESALPKCEQLKFVRFMGQGLPHLTLNRVYSAFKDILGINRLEKIMLEGYNLEAILKKKRKNICNRMHAAAQRDNTNMNPATNPPALVSTVNNCLNSLSSIEAIATAATNPHLAPATIAPLAANEMAATSTPPLSTHFHQENNFNFHYTQ